MSNKVWVEITYSFSNSKCYAAEVWEWKSNFTQYFVIGVITYPCWE